MKKTALDGADRTTDTQTDGHGDSMTNSAQWGRVGEKDYLIGIKNFLNLEGHQNRISGSKVTAILLNGWILPVGGVASV